MAQRFAISPNLHVFREGYEHLEWAEAVDWYDVKNPLGTLERFLVEIRTRFPAGHQLAMI